MDDASFVHDILGHSFGSVVIALGLSFTVLSTTLNFAGVTGLLVAILTSTHESYGRKNSAHLLAMWLSVTIGGTLARIGPSQSALSSPGTSIILSAATMGLTNGVAFATVICSTSISRRASYLSDWMRLCVFPTVWTVVSLVESQTPLGRLVTWTPASDYGLYQWMLPYFGPSALDWSTAAWAVAITELVANRSVISYQDTPDHSVFVRFHGPRRYVPALVTFLVALSIPGITKSPFLTMAPSARNTTTLGVGCILPHISSDHTSLDYYINETTRILSSNARLILWPEGAVTIQTETEKDQMFAMIRGGVYRNNNDVWIAVSYIGPAMNAPGKYLNSLTVINRTDELFTYHKRNLVPLVESYNQVTDQRPSEVYDLPITVWKSGTGKTRIVHNIPLSAGICLDFASSLPLLPRKPALVLAPAHTWHADIGETMSAQARLRAHELGTHVLWCDGGAGGRSALFGPHRDEVYQIGDGSWVKAFQIPDPFDEQSTPYTKYGSWISVVLFCILVPIVPTAVSGLIQPSKFALTFVRHASSQLFNKVTRRRESNQESPLLIDV